MRTYKIKYKIEPGEFTTADAEVKNEGLTDAMLFASVLEDQEGNPSPVGGDC